MIWIHRKFEGERILKIVRVGPTPSSATSSPDLGLSVYLPIMTVDCPSDILYILYSTILPGKRISVEGHRGPDKPLDRLKVKT